MPANYPIPNAGRNQIFQAPTQTPQGQGALNQLINMGLGGLQQNQLNFEPIANQARSNFNRQTIPSIAERFEASGVGPRSSAFRGALGAAGSELDTNLAALRAQYGLHANQQALSQLKTGLSPQFENINYESPEQPQSGFGNALEALSGQSPQFLTQLFKLLSPNQEAPEEGQQQQGTNWGREIGQTLPEVGELAGNFLPIPFGGKIGRGVGTLAQLFSTWWGDRNQQQGQGNPMPMGAQPSAGGRVPATQQLALARQVAGKRFYNAGMMR